MLSRRVSVVVRALSGTVSAGVGALAGTSGCGASGESASHAWVHRSASSAIWSCVCEPSARMHAVTKATTKERRGGLGSRLPARLSESVLTGSRSVGGSPDSGSVPASVFRVRSEG
ncbi:hypothetical protein BJF79_10225 [Actinomadura sp. CNU-125]|nr:hypothetical protein BJF79_10225 [Actinomadura sp. CNU-125]